MRLKLLLFLWILAIFFMTCASIPTESVDSIKDFFKWQAEPELREFFEPLPTLTDSFVMRKIGHIIVFFLLSILLLKTLRSVYLAVSVGFVYGTLTEYIQLYFSRGGRLFDVGFDSIGLAAGLAVFFIISKVFRNLFSGRNERAI